MTQNQIDLVRSGVLDHLGDPRNAQFGEMAASEDHRGAVTVCGQVRARSSFTGAIRIQLYRGDFDRRGAFVPERIGGSAEEQRATRSTCRRDNIDIS